MDNDGLQSDALKNQAIAWDNGCASDPVRNQFIIPELATLIANRRPSCILDVGAGTGYISRMVDSLLDYRPRWVLVDLDEERLEVAHERKPADMDMQCIVGDATADREFEHPFQVVVITFTLLESPSAGAILTTAASTLTDNGLLILAIPDVWADVIADPHKAAERAHRLLKDTVSLHKIDKFTGAPYPFYAMRTESLISIVLELGCTLETLQRGGPHDEVYVLGFRKSPSLDRDLPRG